MTVKLYPIVYYALKTCVLKWRKYLEGNITDTSDEIQACLGPFLVWINTLNLMSEIFSVYTTSNIAYKIKIWMR